MHHKCSKCVFKCNHNLVAKWKFTNEGITSDDDNSVHAVRDIDSSTSSFKRAAIASLKGELVTKCKVYPSLL